MTGDMVTLPRKDRQLLPKGKVCETTSWGSFLCNLLTVKTHFAVPTHPSRYLLYFSSCSEGILVPPGAFFCHRFAFEHWARSKERWAAAVLKGMGWVVSREKLGLSASMNCHWEFLPEDITSASVSLSLAFPSRVALPHKQCLCL